MGERVRTCAHNQRIECQIGNGTSVFHVAECDGSEMGGSNRFVLSWDTQTGRLYSVYSLTNLMWHQWVTNVYHWTGTGSRVTYTNTAPEPGRFFRIGVERQP